jgi:hypothetical protein
MSRPVVGLSVLALLVGASTTAAPVPVHLMPKEPPLYFPTRVGAKWVYQVGKEELTLSVTAVERTERGTLVTVTNHRPGGNTFIAKKMLVTPTSVTQVEGSEGKLDSPWCWLKSPCAVGEKWESDCSTENFVQKWQCTALGTEEVEVPAGKFTAVRVHTTHKSVARNGQPCFFLDSTSDEWHAPGVGVVKEERQHPEFSKVLKSFTP